MAQQSSCLRLCAICMDGMAPNCRRTVVTLQCSHQFHLDCIGSTFNVDGIMRCPICRATENGVWRRFTSCINEEGIHDQDAQQDIEMQSPGYHWCPVHGQQHEYPWCPIHGQQHEYPWCPIHGQPTEQHWCCIHGRVDELLPEENQDLVQQPANIAGNPNIAHHWTGTSVPNQNSDSHFFQQNLQNRLVEQPVNIAGNPNVAHRWTCIPVLNRISASPFIQHRQQNHQHRLGEQPVNIAGNHNIACHWSGPPLMNQISASHFIRGQNLVFVPVSENNSGAYRTLVPFATMRSNLGDLDGVQNLDSSAHQIILEHRHAPPLQSFWMPRPHPMTNLPLPARRASMMSRMRRSNGMHGLYPAGQTAASLGQAGSFVHVPQPNFLTQNLHRGVSLHHHVQETNGTVPFDSFLDDMDSLEYPDD